MTSHGFYYIPVPADASLHWASPGMVSQDLVLGVFSDPFTAAKVSENEKRSFARFRTQPTSKQKVASFAKL